jgi:hypothetical protein
MLLQGNHHAAVPFRLSLRVLLQAATALLKEADVN